MRTMFDLETIIMIAIIVGATTAIGLFVKERHRVIEVIEEDFAKQMESEVEDANSPRISQSPTP